MLTYLGDNKYTTWITSDNHFGHANVIQYANRPYSSCLEMDIDMIDRWNSVVGKHDSVFHLGDFCLGDARMARHYFSRLNGHVYIIGLDWHHDNHWLNKAEGMSTASGGVHVLPPLYIVRHVGVRLTLSHYPMYSWEMAHYGMPHMYGHMHQRTTGRPNSYNVCVEHTQYAPMNLTAFLENYSHELDCVLRKL